MNSAPPLNPTRLGPTEAEETAALEAFERHALSQGIILEGKMAPFSEGYNVIARRADTGEPLLPGFPVTLRMAENPEEFRAALEQLLADAVTALVRK